MTGGILRFRDRLYVLLLGAAIAALAWVWRFETVPPDLMDSLSAAAGLRPPTGPLSLLWWHIAAPLCQKYGLPTAGLVLRTAGHVSLGLVAVLSAILFRMMLPTSLQRGEHVASWWRVLVRFVLFQGVVLFCCSYPVWNTFRWFSPGSLQTLLAFFASICVIVHFRTERQLPLFVSFMLLGLLAADTPVGAVLLLVVVAALGSRRYLRNAGLLYAPEGSPFAGALMSWRLTLAFAVGVAAGVTLEVRAFDSLDGFAVFGWAGSDYALEFPIIYVKELLELCTPGGAVLILGVTALPVAAEFGLMRRVMDDEKHLVYIYGALFAVLGLFALSQLSGAKSLWFWRWGGGCVSDCVLKCISMYLCAISVVWSLAVFMMELYFRNFRRIETLRFPDAAEAVDAAAELAPTLRLQRIVRAVFLLEPVLVLGCAVPFRAQSLERSMLGVVADAARETADECRDVDFLFTDGGLDAAVELAAAASGRRLRALSMMGGAADPREIYLRTRGVEDAEDRALLESGAADALRTWVRTRPDKAKTYAVQIGFELWRRDGRPMPECSGLVARPEGLAPEDAARGSAAGRALAERLIAVYGDGQPDAIPNGDLRDAFHFVQWRLAVLARHRANAYDGRGETTLAMEETRLADELDKKNNALARIRDTMAWASKRKLERMTPQEGLRLGLARADFAFARTFALRVLDISPDDPAANFALGMDFFVQRQYARAEAYLERCRERRPDDPAVLNNLAQCRLRQGDPAGALPYAEHALEMLPGSPEIKRTMERIKAALNGAPDASSQHGTPDQPQCPPTRQRSLTGVNGSSNSRQSDLNR